MIPVLIMIRKGQKNFIQKEKEKGRVFNLSKFVRVKLDDNIRFVEVGNDFNKKCAGSEDYDN